MRAAAQMLLVLLALSAVAAAQAPPCAPCAGITVDDPGAVLRLFESAPVLDENSRFFLRWKIALDGTADADLATSVAQTGATPWQVLVFQVPMPIADHLDMLAEELEETARLVRGSPSNTHFEVEWRVEVTTSEAVQDYAFLLKRASVAVKGARDETRVIAAGLPIDSALLTELYDANVAAYIDGVAFHGVDDEGLTEVVELVTDLDPGRPVVHDAGPLPDSTWRALPSAAQAAASGAAVTFFDTTTADLKPGDLDPLMVLAREFSGDLAYDPYSTPSGGAGGWAFVRGEDLGLRVIVDRGDFDGATAFVFPDAELQDPARVLGDGNEGRVSAGRVPDGYMVEVDGSDPAAVVRLERPSAADLGGFSQDLDVTDVRQIPVEEILRRLQAFEDAQFRKIHHYEAIYTQHFRYRPGSGIQVIEASFSGPYFFHRGQGFDWMWQRFLVNGVLWKGKIPKLPLLQPERAAAKPLEITLDLNYSYRLRGTAEVQGRPCWVVDFEPAGEVEEKHLWKGTVWIDREIYARVKTRALQLGLAGDVISNEETQFIEPVDSDGQPAPWAADSYFLPTRVEAQELQSILNVAVQVEKQSLLTEIRINSDGFETRLEEAHASRDTMVRDTPDGLRYLDRQDDGSRVVVEKDNPNRWFALGGVYWDEGQDYPVPLVGVDFFSSDFLETGTQFNLIFAGVLLNGNWAEPSLFGSRWDAGTRVFGFFLGTDEELYRDGALVPEETVESKRARLDFYLGRPIGSFFKAELAYGLEWNDYDRADDTADDFVLPEGGLTNSVTVDLSYSRNGYRVGLEGSYHDRGDWSFWGLPDNTDYDPNQKDYQRWSLVAGKTWWPGNFTKIGVELEHLDGADLDRFSKYDFSTFGSGRVAGYQGGLVTASEADGVHVVGGLNFAETLRVEGELDVVWATDEATGLDRELLAGIGVGGTVMGPWQTLVNFEVGVPIAGPADSFTVFVTFLKLFN